MALDEGLAEFFSYHGVTMRKTLDGHMEYLVEGSPCRHYRDGGCDIYEQRPRICRDYLCLEARTGVGPSAAEGPAPHVRGKQWISPATCSTSASKN